MKRFNALRFKLSNTSMKRLTFFSYSSWSVFDRVTTPHADRIIMLITPQKEHRAHFLWLMNHGICWQSDMWHLKNCGCGFNPGWLKPRDRVRCYICQRKGLLERDEGSSANKHVDLKSSVTGPRCWSTRWPLWGERTSQCLVGYETGFESVWLGVNTGFAVRVHTISYRSLTRWLVKSKAVGLSLSGLGLGRGKERVALQAQIQAQKPFTQVCDVELDFSEELLLGSWKSYIK